MIFRGIFRVLFLPCRATMCTSSYIATKQHGSDYPTKLGYSEEADECENNPSRYIAKLGRIIYSQAITPMIESLACFISYVKSNFVSIQSYNVVIRRFEHDFVCCNIKQTRRAVYCLTGSGEVSHSHGHTMLAPKIAPACITIKQQES